MRLCWQFPEGFQLAVAIYNLVQPATKPKSVWVEDNNHELLRTENAMIDQDTGGQDAGTYIMPNPPTPLPGLQGQLSFILIIKSAALILQWTGLTSSCQTTALTEDESTFLSEAVNRFRLGMHCRCGGYRGLEEGLS